MNLIRLSEVDQSIRRQVLVDVGAMRVVWLRFEPGYALDQHHHPVADEIYSVIEGSAVLEAGGRRWTRKLWSALVFLATLLVLYVAIAFHLIAMTVSY